jgi:hypothetical protein
MGKIKEVTTLKAYFKVKTLLSHGNNTSSDGYRPMNGCTEVLLVS